MKFKRDFEGDTTFVSGALTGAALALSGPEKSMPSREARK
jgi:hypothetical protein